MHVAILGNGVAGISAALRLRELRPDWRITVVSGESTHHWSRPALMYVFMGHMRYQDTKPFEDSLWGERRIDLVRGWVTRIDLEKRRLELSAAPPIHWDGLLLATGSKPNRFGWPGQDLDGVQGLWGLPDLKRLVEATARARRAVIVGGGLIGVELAEMLHSRGIHVTMLVRERSYWDNVLPPEESALVTREIRRHGIEVRLATELASIEDDGHGRAAAAVTKAGERLPCEIVGLTAGVSPNLDVIRGTAIRTGRGVRVDRSLRTSVPGVLAAGDCAEIELDDGKTLLQQVWYTGKRQGEVAAAVLAGEEARYEPGIWFNSAKFFDVEYQTYGRVDPVPGAQPSVWWEHADGRMGVRLALDDGRLAGVNVLGIRWRHAVCERWIAERRPLAEVLPRLAEAAFDPELHRRHEGDLARALGARVGTVGSAR